MFFTRSAPTLTTFGLPNQYALFEHDFSLLNRSKISIHNTHLLRGGYFLYVSIGYQVYAFKVLLYICNTKWFHPINTDVWRIAFAIRSSEACGPVHSFRSALFSGYALGGRLLLSVPMIFDAWYLRIIPSSSALITDFSASGI